MSELGELLRAMPKVELHCQTINSDDPGMTDTTIDASWASDDEQRTIAARFDDELKMLEVPV